MAPWSVSGEGSLLACRGHLPAVSSQLWGEGAGGWRDLFSTQKAMNSIGLGPYLYLLKAPSPNTVILEGQSFQL